MLQHSLLRLVDVCRHTALAKSTIYLYISQGAFPRPVRLGAGRVAWRLEEVENWIASRQAT